jgi:hypothetical protein
MHLPHPSAQLAGCCWLPRLAAKTRAFLRGEIPPSYRVAFGSRIGVDGYFLRHFRLSLAQVVAAVRAAPDDAALAAWFLARPGVNASSLAAWNALAPRLGSPGHPGRRTLLIVRYFLYPKSIFRTPRSIFEAISIDENLPPTGGS